MNILRSKWARIALLCTLAIVTLHAILTFPEPRLDLKYHAETAMPGDTIYFTIVAKNPHALSIYVPEGVSPTERDIRMSIRDSENQDTLLLFEANNTLLSNRAIFCTKIPPGKSRMLAALAINIPALEDIHTPFWEKHLKELPAEGKEFTLNVDLEFYSASFWRGEPGGTRTLSRKILLKPRPDKEMAMIQQWYDKTPKELFPEPDRKNDPVRKDPSHHGGWLPKSEVIRVHGEEYSQWHFIRLGNRFPADPNAPETWQGWKELEESITPSTMRDEIRLTRILIQYCDTDDAKVLMELEDWFVGMNQVQRTVMAKNIGDLAWDTRGTKLFEPFKKIYAVVKKYDIAAKSDEMKKYFEKAGL